MTKSLCSNCRNQMTGWDGGFFGEPLTCECRIYGETEGRKNCSKFKKRITKSDLLNKIQSLEKENEQLKQSNDRFADTVAKQVSLLIELRKENEQLRQIIKDIVCATDETYTKNTSMFKVTVVFDGKMYNQIRSCLYE